MTNSSDAKKRAKNGSVPRYGDADYKTSYQKIVAENAALKTKLSSRTALTSEVRNALAWTDKYADKDTIAPVLAAFIRRVVGEAK